MRRKLTWTWSIPSALSQGLGWGGDPSFLAQRAVEQYLSQFAGWRSARLCAI